MQNLLNDANSVLGSVKPGAPNGSDPNTAYETVRFRRPKECRRRGAIGRRSRLDS
jgi:hypothetical protein